MPVSQATLIKAIHVLAVILGLASAVCFIQMFFLVGVAMTLLAATLFLLAEFADAVLLSEGDTNFT